MKNNLPVLMALALVVLAASACSPQTPAPALPKGHLFIIGGGDRDAPLMKRFIQLAEAQATGKIVIFTMASSVPQEVGPELVAEFKGNGARDVAFYQLAHIDAVQPGSERILDGAGGVWFSGGDQALLTAALLGTPIHMKMLELYKAGCVIGGTSAGAAVMSEFMITGNEKRTGGEEGTWEVILAGDVEHTQGFGFVQDAVIDQHFVTRRRHNRLIAVVLEHPALVGVGIEESTAVLVRPDGKYEVLGEGQVIVYDARRATTAKSPGRPSGRPRPDHARPSRRRRLRPRRGPGRGAVEMKGKPLRLPHTLILIYIMVVLTVVATWIIPGGEYQRVEKDGRMVPVAGSYARVENEPQGLGGLFVSPVRGFVDAAAIIAILLIVGGAFNVIQQTGAIAGVIHNITFTFGRSKALRVLLIPVVMILFSLGGGVWGMCEETMPFILVFVPLALSLGYDTIVGVAMCFVGAAAGFAGAFFNPFTVGIAQGIAGLPLYSGLGYRLAVWAGGTAIAVAVVMRYAARIHKDPALSPTYAEDQEKEEEAQRRQARPRARGPHRGPQAGAPRLRRRLRLHGLRHPQVQVVHQRDRRGVPGHGRPGRPRRPAQGRRVRPGLRRRGQGHGQRRPHHRRGPGHPHRGPGRQDPRHHPGRHGRGHLPLPPGHLGPDHVRFPMRHQLSSSTPGRPRRP